MMLQKNPAQSIMPYNPQTLQLQGDCIRSQQQGASPGWYFPPSVCSISLALAKLGKVEK